MHRNSLLTDTAIDALVKLRELMPGTGVIKLIEAALVEFAEAVQSAQPEPPAPKPDEVV